jgi:hypothetical protein
MPATWSTDTVMDTTLKYSDLKYSDLKYSDLKYSDLKYSDLKYSDQHVPVNSPVPLRGLYELADRRGATQQLQCRNLLAAIVDSRQMGSGFYTRKALMLQSLQLSDAKLKILRSRFRFIFRRLAMFEQKGSPPLDTQLSQEASQLVNELNQYCFY